jgi:formate/nitrite transporter FocA (FNT family)
MLLSVSVENLRLRPRDAPVQRARRSRIVVTFVIGFAGLHHSIAGAIEVLMAVVAGAGPTGSDYARIVLWSVIGNAVGGSVFVALLKFGHVHASRQE